MKKFIVVFMFIIGCGYGNIDYIKQHASETLKSNGFEIIGYQGYDIGYGIPFTVYGGANVWYTIKDKEGVVYECALKRWNNEIHIYNLRALNVNKQNKE